MSTVEHQSASSSEALPENVKSVSHEIMRKSLANVREVFDCPVNRGASSERNRETLQHLADAISRLTYSEYLQLIDLAVHVRRDPRYDFATHAQELIRDTGENALVDPRYPSALVEVIDLLRALQDEQDFRDDMALITRIAYPFGVNIVNKTFDTQLPVSLDAKKSHKILAGFRGTTYSIDPAGPGKCTISLDGRSIELAEGEAKIIGRSYDKEKFFGKSVLHPESKRGVHIHSALETPDGSVSRAGIMILLKDGQLYVFDRGSNYPVALDSGGDVLSVFLPNEIGADGTMGSCISMSRADFNDEQRKFPKE